MLRIYKRVKVLVILLALLYLSLYIYRLIYVIKLDHDRMKLLETLTKDPICTAHGNIVNRLNRLAKYIIKLKLDFDYRDDESDKSSELESYYDNVQQLIIEIETITNIKHKRSKEKRLVKNKVSRPSVVCPEIYLGSTFGYPFYSKGFETTNCSSKVPMESLVTLIFDEVPVVVKTNEGELIADQSIYVDQLTKFISSVSAFYPKVANYFMLNITDNLLDSLENKVNRKLVKFVRLRNVTRGRAIQDVIDEVKTPYVLLANHLTQFTEHIDLERLVRVASSKSSIIAVGASSRNLTGHWSNNCYRLQLKNYTLEYKQGYHRSFNECLVCDHLDGSFLAKTSILKTFKFDSSLDHGIYKDLFLRIKYRFYSDGYNHRRAGFHVKNKTDSSNDSYYRVNGYHSNTNKGSNGHTGKTYYHGNIYEQLSLNGYPGNPVVVSCPDVLFHEQTYDVRDEHLITFASRHSIRKIIEESGKVRWYGCKRDVKHRIGDRCALRRGLAVPPCCLENLADAVKFIMNECLRNNIICELQEGTLLGAVKFNKVLPWERDADITFLTSDYDKLLNIKPLVYKRGYVWRDISSPRCCVGDKMAGGQIEILADGWSIQMYGQHSMDSERLVNQGVRPTIVPFCGQWVNVPENPGKYVRNRYGRNIYRHAEHWITTGQKSGWTSYDTKEFSVCPVKGFHGCLDQYNIDGSVQFENLF